MLDILLYMVLGGLVTEFLLWIVIRIVPLPWRENERREQQQEEEKTPQKPWTKSEAEVDERRALMTFITNDICPNCSKNVMFLEGPCGGASQNIKCPDCGQKYNWCPGFFAERIPS